MSEIEHIKLILSAAKALEQEIKKLTITENDRDVSCRSQSASSRHKEELLPCDRRTEDGIRAFRLQD
jgi:hypothetical protein